MFVCDLFIQTVLALSEYTQLKNIHFFLGLPHIYISHVICLPTTLHICAHTNTVSECCWTITVAFMFAIYNHWDPSWHYSDNPQIQERFDICSVL